LLFKDFCQNVTMHGFRFLFEGSFLRRFIWFLITSTITAFVVVLFYNLLFDYLEHKTVTVNDFEDVATLQFPTVSICPLNTISNRKLQELKGNLTTDEIKYFIDGVIKNKTNSTVYKKVMSIINKEGINTYMELLNAYMNSYEDFADTKLIRTIFDKGGEKQNQSISCDFYERPCNKSDFVIVEYLPKMLCFDFNTYQKGNPGLTIRSNGYFNGFSLTFDLSDIKKISVLDGFYLEMTSYGNTFGMNTDNEIISVNPGWETAVKITQTETRHLKSKCGEKELKFIKDRPYTKTTSINDCMFQHVYKKFGCAGPDIYHQVQGIPYCTIKEMAGYFHYRDNEDVEKQCIKSCPNECRRVGYNFLKDKRKLGNRGVYKILQHDMPGWGNKTITEIAENVRENIVRIHISFFQNQIKIEEITEKVEWITLIATIGGNIGLGLGFSFVTAFEFLFFFYDYFNLLFTKKRK
uniref:Uncharacterized protein n=2 Tax=Clytia hemisphaerica TaxID=252671 RepID=A0A7M5V5Y4_9CNID